MTDYPRLYIGRALKISKGADKLHVLYGGTKMLMVTDPAKRSSVGPVNLPGDAVVVYALRTGFDTSQGKLMRTILFSTEQVRRLRKVPHYINRIEAKPAFNTKSSMA